MFGIAQWFACDKCWNRSTYTEHIPALDKKFSLWKKKKSFNSLLDFLLFFIKESQPLGIQEGEYSFIKAHLPFYGNGNNSMPEEKAALQTHIST